MMSFECVLNNDLMLYVQAMGALETNCYLLVHPVQKRVLIIDPADDGDMIYHFIQEKGWEIDAVLLTHGHYDHIMGLNALRQETRAPVLIHKADAAMLSNPHLNLSFFMGCAFQADPPDQILISEQNIAFCDRSFQLFHIPGHTPGGICLHWPGVLISGDVLFAGNIGRSDLPGGDEALLIQGIRQNLMTLPDDTRVFPGHGFETTIGREKKRQPWLWKN